MAAIPWMPLYVSDYLADTGHLGTIEHGAYFLMMMHYWTKGPLPSDEGQLRKIARMTPREWSDARGVLLDFFFLGDDGHYHHGRIDKELATASEMIDAKSRAGKDGAAKRWQKQKQSDGTANASAMANPIANECERTAPLPSPSPPANAGISRAPPRARSKTILNGHERDFTEFWDIYPKRVDKRDAMKAYAKALERADAATILAGATAYAQNRKDEDPQFTKGPAHWLNADCWLDETGPLKEKIDPDKVAEHLDRADRLMKRGKYAPDYKADA